MKYLVTLLLAIFATICYAQDDKTVTLVASGSGKTQDEAKQNALRSAIEQAFGTFISSNTEILNDDLVKDEIVSVANGNIQKYEIISEVQIPNGGYATSLKATVSVTKLTSFVGSKGVAIEFKGSLFAFNVNQQILNEKNEIKAIEDLCKVITNFSNASFEYSIKASDPVAVNSSNEQWRIPLHISVSANKNLISIANYMNQTLKGLSLSIDEANNYIKLGKLVYPISFAASYSKYGYYLLRSEKSIKLLLSQLYYFNKSIQYFNISNGIDDLKSIIPVKSINNFIITMKVYKAFSGGYTLEAFKPVSISEIEEDEAPAKYLSKYPIDPPAEVIGGRTAWCAIQYCLMEANKNFTNQFSFIKNLELLEEPFVGTKLPHEQPDITIGNSGLVISFINIKEGSEIFSFNYEDIRTLEEINKITGYKISSISN